MSDVSSATVVEGIEVTTDRIVTLVLFTCETPGDIG